MIYVRDIAVLLAAARAPEGWTMRSLGDELGLAPAAVHRSLGRLAAVGLYAAPLRTTNFAVVDEFIRHGLRFVDTRTLGVERRGFPTAWSVEPLRSGVWSGSAAPPVWPDASGPSSGPSLEPLIEGAVALLERSPEIATDLALVDAIRIGNARERSNAADLLMERLAAVAS